MINIDRASSACETSCHLRIIEHLSGPGPREHTVCSRDRSTIDFQEVLSTDSMDMGQPLAYDEFKESKVIRTVAARRPRVDGASASGNSGNVNQNVVLTLVCTIWVSWGCFF